MVKKYSIRIVLVCACIMIAYFTKQQVTYSIKKQGLMIVAHPDDETIFAGNEILTNSYFIVCLTNGDNATRKAEFEEMLKQTNNQGIILSYPDKVNGERSSWHDHQEDIKNTVESYIEKENWNAIITHNPQGEYGHIHHQMTNKIVTEIVLSHDKQDTLHYFAPYFKKDNLPANKTMNTYAENKKKELAKLYTSQEKTVTKLSHIFGYEYFTSYTDIPF
jgi:LmbE family N-acetylglucosaminyl deacetylase